MSFSLVCLHAHPDDEALLTAGTLARAAAEGHRVTLVVATDGSAGLADSAPGAELADRRAAELERSARALGVHRVVRLGYPDSGLRNELHGFADVPAAEAADRLAGVLAEERADLLIGYDANGGYGHPDHLQVHRVARHAHRLAAGRLALLEATVDRTALLRALRLLQLARLAPPDFHPDRMRAAYTARSEISHRIDVRGYLDAKRAAMAAHASQAGGGADTRTLAYCLKLPRPLYRLAFGTEWFLDPDRPAGRPVSGDLFAALQ
ncbi:MAG TPA: PIG-L family deacetylase [Jatrophihabitans sp.]|nr:PIG-L family deacetylase [Jatrophihabitans sp.]